ncbi:MAG: iron-containing alcohol dehydrogenase [Phycisphaeraceae bacterium]|nr:iron-containing alcohol dehydrogenase [Phycisphaeraceae bacterium]
MSNKKQQAADLLRNWKGRHYVFGLNCFERLGDLAAEFGRRASLVVDGAAQAWSRPIQAAAMSSLVSAGVEPAGELIPGAGPNAPREDVFRIGEAIGRQQPDVVIAIGGGSGIDAVKAAVAHHVLGGDFDSYFGVGQVTAQLEAANKKMIPLVAVQLASSSAAHLTKYSNVTDFATNQKMLIVDQAVVPPKALFDYRWTTSMPKSFTMDGALDGIAHALEVLMGIPDDKLALARQVCLLAIDLVVHHIKIAADDPNNLPAREALGLATDLGGYAIMIGGTNGAHLNSFSLVDLLPHGRACALMNPYYVVFFAPAIEERLRAVGEIYASAGYSQADYASLCGRELGLAVARAMVALSDDIGFPTTLSQVDGFSQEHVTRCLSAAKNPKLESKLKNMPVPLSADTIDRYMGPILEAATTGEFAVIRNMG